MTQLVARVATAGAALLVSGGLMTATAPQAAAVPPDASMCQEQRAAAQALSQEIAAHNAKPHLFTLPQERAGYDAYNAEAAALEARKGQVQARLDACIGAATKLSNPDGAGLPVAMPKELPQMLRHARTTAAPRQDDVEALLDVLDDAAQKYDDEWAEQVLQDQPQPKVGDSDPAFPDGTIYADAQGKPQVTPDYVVPLTDILEMPKFMDLSPESMWMVTMSPVNRQWISDQAVLAKHSESVAAVTGVNQEWLQKQDELAMTVMQQLQEAIDLLLQSQEPEK